MASKQLTKSRSLLLSASSSSSPSLSSELIDHSTTTSIQKSLQRVLMKPKRAHPGLYKARLNSDVVSLSAGGPRDSRCISAVRFVSALQISLLWRTPWTYITFARAYGSASESRKREIRVSDEDDDNEQRIEDDDVEDEQHIEDDDDDVEDEQIIEDDDDDDDEEEEEDVGQGMQSQGHVKKKIQTKPPKSKDADPQKCALNGNITARTVRLVNDDEGHRIVSREEALALAKDKNLDLVLVDGKANPPVCKIFDFHREEYKKERVMKERKKKKGAMVKLSELKELRFNTKTEPKDLKMKVEKAKKFMERGYRVKFVANLKGSFDDEKKRREQEKMINAIYSLVEDVAVVEQAPRLETRNAWVVLRHVKFGQNKKKAPKGALQFSANEQVDDMKNEVEFPEQQEEKNTHPFQSSFLGMPAPNATSVPMGRSEGYPSKVTGSSMQSSTLRSPHEEEVYSHVQSPPTREPDERLKSGMQSPPPHRVLQHTQSLKGFGGLRSSETPVSPPHGFPQHTPFVQGFGGLRGSETPVSSPPAPPRSTQMQQAAGVQGPGMQVLPPHGFPHEAGDSHGFPQHTLFLQGIGGLLGSETAVSPPPRLPPSTQMQQGAGAPPRGFPAHEAGESHGFPQHTPFLQGFGGLQGSETPVSPPPGHRRSTQTQEGAGVKGPTMQVSPRGFPQHAHEAGDSHSFPQQTPLLQGFGRLRGSETPVSHPPGPPPSTQMQQGAGVHGPRLQVSPPRGFPQHAHEPGDSHGFPQHATFLQGFGGLRGSEPPVSPPPGPRPSTRMQQGAGVQGPRMQVSPPRGFPQHAHEAGDSHGFPQHTPFLQGFGGLRGSEPPLSPPPGPPPSTQMHQGAGVQGPRMQVSRGFPQHAREAGDSHAQAGPLLDLDGFKSIGIQRPPPHVQPHQRSPPHVQPQPLLDLDGFKSSGMQRPPPHLYPQHTPSQEGLGGLRGSETPVSPPRGPPLFTPRLQGAGVQGPRMQVSPPGGFPLHANKASHSHGQSPPPQDPDGGLLSGMQLPPARGFPQHASSLQGFGGSRGSEAYGFQKDPQNQASQGYPPQRGFPQTRAAQEAYSSQGDGQIHPQSQASQGYPPQRGFLQARPVVPPPPPPPPPPSGYRPSWSKPSPQSQEYPPLFESPSEKS